jgi:6-phosphogluconate dehydrogenase
VAGTKKGGSNLMETEHRDQTGRGGAQGTGSVLGMVGLGVMGRNLVLNMADHGFAVAGFDLDADRVASLVREAAKRPVVGMRTPEELIGALQRPRTVMMLVPAGKPVDSVIHELIPHLDQGDLIVDGGNSYFKDTLVRARALESKHLFYLGVGISGGEEGARKGPSIMPGGPKEAYERIRPVFESVAAHVKGEPCVAWLGPGAAGHYVKMVHNGIEYAVMQLIAETYDVMKRGLGMSDAELHDTYSQWSSSEAESYLLEITAHIFAEIDPGTGKPLVEVVLDEAKQLGTGEWASQDALEIGVPTPSIDIAVAARHLSTLREQRERAADLFPCQPVQLERDRAATVRDLRDSFYAGMILCYAQGMAQLATASEHYGYGLDLETVARIWRGGCIIRAALLEDIAHAFRRNPGLVNLLADADVGSRVADRQPALRRAVCTGVEWGIPVPGLSAALAYFDSYRSAWLPANLVQAQRDYFGAHTYERVDEKGTFHTQWPEVD